MGEKLYGQYKIMDNRPEIKPGDWIIVQNVDCVVANVRQPGLYESPGVNLLMVIKSP
jgi:hypothetical protein